MNEKILFIGEGHGGIVALLSLQNVFDSIDVLTDDKQILDLMRSTDRQVKNIEDSEAKIAVCAGYNRIVPEGLLIKKVFINTHPSLLPKYRGRHALVWAMLNFEKELGFTIHLMNKYIDDGDILEQYKIKYNGETSWEIMVKFDEYVKNNLGRVVKEFIEGKIKPKKQNKDEATWVCKRNLNDCVINFNENNEYISMMFKALVRPYPLPMVKVNGKLYEITKHKLININYKMHIGRVVNIEDNKVYIKTKDGLLVIEELIDYETKSKININELFKIGQRLC